MIKGKIYILSLLSLLFGCKEGTKLGSDYMSFDEVLYVKDFPKKISLYEKEKIDFGVLGINRFRIVDTLMFVSTNESNALWKLVSLPKHTLLGAFLKKGQGPNDFPMPPNLCSQTWISNQNGDWVAHIYDFNKGRVSKLNVSQTLKEKTENIAALNSDLPQGLFNIQMLNEESFFCKELNDDATKQERFILNENKKVASALLQKLNNAQVKKEKNINILSTLIKYNDEKDILVEVPIGLNYINMYSLQNDSLAKTVCIDKSMYSISEVENTYKWNRMYTFSDVRSFKDFFGILYINETEKNYQTTREKKPTVFLFDWEGNPLVELELNQLATSFDIDVKNKMLYTLDTLTDEMFIYDISNVIQ